MNDSTVEPTSLLDIAQRRASRDGSTPFLLTIDPTDASMTTLSYGEVLARATALSELLTDAGVARGDRVGCYLANSPSWVVASLAVWMTGSCVASAGTLLPEAEASALFSLAGATVVVTTAPAAGLEADFRIVWISDAGQLATLSPPHGEVLHTAGSRVPDPSDQAVAIFTSGTTGTPKGITHTHGDIIAACRRVAAAYAKTSDFRPDPAPAHLAPGVLFNPFGHMAGYSRVAFRMWIGRPTVLVPKFSVEATRAVLDAFPLDTLQLSPAMIQMLATAEDPLDLSTVKYVTSGTAPLPTATRDLFEQRYGVPVMQAYGMTETGAVAQERYEDVVSGRRGPGSVGRLAEGVQVQIRQLEDDRPDGEGEILVRTDEVSDEFLGGEQVPLDDDGWFATGDVGRLDDGILYITGRVQEKMIVGGFNVYPAEVEEVARRSALVADVVVVSLPDDRLGEIPVAGIVWASEPDVDELMTEMRASLARYKVPRHFITLSAVPHTARDKVDRKKATELARATLDRTPESGRAWTTGPRATR